MFERTKSSPACPCSRRIIAISIILWAALAGPVPSEAQSTDPDLPKTNGRVRALAKSGNTLYIGGDFTLIGPFTGPGAVLDAATGAAIGSQIGATMPGAKVRAAAPDGAGGWFVGGQFQLVRGQSRQNLAHILADGSLSPWLVNVNADVYTIAVVDSVVYIGGAFTIVAGQSRNRVAAVHAVTGTLLPLNPNSDGTVRALAVGGSKLFMGGSFAQVGGQSRAQAAAVDLATGAVTAWDPHASSVVQALAVSGGTVYAGGQFTGIGDALRNYIAALDTTGGFATSWNPNSMSGVNAVSVRNGVVYAGGQFHAIGGMTRNYIAAIDSASGIPTGWNPNTNLDVNSIAVSDSVIYAGGLFGTVGGLPRAGIAALDKATGAPTPWRSDAVGGVVHVVAVSGGTIYAGGEFSMIGTTPRRYLAAIDVATNTVLPWDPNPDGQINALALDGSTLFTGGGFSSIGGQPRLTLAAIDTGTGLALPWNAGIGGNPPPYVLALRVSGTSLYVGGNFSAAGGQLRNNLACLGAGSALSTPWNPDVYNEFGPTEVDCVTTDGSRVYIGGRFTSVGSTPRAHLAAIDATTGLAVPGWRPDPDGQVVYAVEVYGSQLYFSGIFTHAGGSVRNNIAAVDRISGALTSWPSRVGSGGAHYALGAGDGVIYAGDYGLCERDTVAGASNAWTGNIFGDVAAILVDGPRVYAGGSFQVGNLAVLSSFGVLDVPSAETGTRMVLAQSLPNPAGFITTIRFVLPTARTVTLRVHDIAGRLVAVPIDHESLRAGPHQRGVDVGSLPNGLYFYSLSGNGSTVTRRMIVAR
jgi:hypothetical protein